MSAWDMLAGLGQSERNDFASMRPRRVSLGYAPGAQLVVLTEIFSLFARIGWFLAETCQTVFPLQRENPYVPVG